MDQFTAVATSGFQGILSDVTTAGFVLLGIAIIVLGVSVLKLMLVGSKSDEDLDEGSGIGGIAEDDEGRGMRR